jgi:hypothetical protein
MENQETQEWKIKKHIKKGNRTRKHSIEHGLKETEVNIHAQVR